MPYCQCYYQRLHHFLVSKRIDTDNGASFVDLLIIIQYFMKMKKYIAAAMTLATVAGLAAAAVPVFAAGMTGTVTRTHGAGIGRMHGKGGPGRGGMMKQGVFGTVSAINGNIITITSQKGFGTTATTSTLTVDATNATVTKDNVASSLSNIAIGDMISATGTTTGSNTVATTIRDGKAGAGRGGMMNPGVFGTVSAINGNNITITGKQGFGTTATTVTYTIDATSATITKANVAGTISSIAIGDTIAVQGTVTGTSVAATSIRDGIMMRGSNGIEDEAKGAPEQPGDVSNTPSIGNGQPIVAGSVTAVTGSTITITNKSNATFTIDATNAKFTKGNTTATISNIAVGDSIVAQGTVNGSSVSATMIIDQARSTTSTTAPATSAPKAGHEGILAGIGSFFKHLFGF